MILLYRGLVWVILIFFTLDLPVTIIDKIDGASRHHRVDLLVLLVVTKVVVRHPCMRVLRIQVVRIHVSTVCVQLELTRILFRVLCPIVHGVKSGKDRLLMVLLPATTYHMKLFCTLDL